MKPSKLIACCLCWKLSLLLSCGRQAVVSEKVEAKSAVSEGTGREAGVIRLSRQQQSQTSLAVEIVQPRSVPLSIEASGRITINENRMWSLGAVVEGRIVRVYAGPGDTVQAGQRIASMHSHDIHEVRADYWRAKSELIRAQAQEAFARKQRDRLQRLYQLKAASLEQLEHAEADLRNAQAAVANAETDLERHRIHIVEFLQLPVEGHDDHKTGDALHEEDLVPVKSPATGTVIRRNVTPGSVAKPGEELFAIADLSTVWMIAALQEEHLGSVRVGMPVEVLTQAFRDRTFRGKITKIGEQLDPATRTVQLRVELANPLGMLKPEMYAMARIEAGGSAEILTVPQTAVQQVNGQPVVFLQLDPERFEVRAIQTGSVFGDRVEVRQGLRSGDRVVTQGSYLLKSQLLKASLAEDE
ncbi:MAG: efflux RND transporter periplasmic adaptor subunit [Bryobacteraceae bacterium]|nr:efflux RND transporter periplasmic adaptor subunit [Bryobacteraceae bacterium]MDW8379326.1 efflux RND transporter periplasmic adaptor subunit [Bryobacterales bacterium]